MMVIRSGEALGLCWDDVDYEAKGLRLHRQPQRVDKVLVIRETKTKSWRILPRPDVVAEALKAHRKLQLKERLFAGDKWREQGLGLTSSIGTPLDPNNVSRRSKALARSAGLPEEITLHSRRHSSGSLLVAAKVDVRQTMDILGHTQTSTAMNLNAHILPAAGREAANAMDAAIGCRTKASKCFLNALDAKFAVK